jgi:hypothetical protein
VSLPLRELKHTHHLLGDALLGLDDVNLGLGEVLTFHSNLAYARAYCPICLGVKQFQTDLLP